MSSSKFIYCWFHPLAYFRSSACVTRFLSVCFILARWCFLLRGTLASHIIQFLVSSLEKVWMKIFSSKGWGENLNETTQTLTTLLIDSWDNGLGGVGNQLHNILWTIKFLNIRLSINVWINEMIPVPRHIEDLRKGTLHVYCVANDGLTYFRFFQTPRHQTAIPVGDSVPVTRFIPSQLSGTSCSSRKVSAPNGGIHSQLLRFIECTGYTIHLPGHFFSSAVPFESWAQLKETDYPHL